MKINGGRQLLLSFGFVLFASNSVGGSEVFTQTTESKCGHRWGVSGSLEDLAKHSKMVTKSPAVDDPEVLNVKAEGVGRSETNQTLIGPSHTQVFYTLGDANTIVGIRLSNESLEFPIGGTVYRFAAGTTQEALDKWINNQTSDALFADAPEPVETIKLPEDSISITSSEFVEEQVAGPRQETFRKYKVEFAVRRTELSDELEVKAFKDAATVSVRPGAAK